MMMIVNIDKHPHLFDNVFWKTSSFYLQFKENTKGYKHIYDKAYYMNNHN